MYLVQPLWSSLDWYTRRI